MGEAWLRMKSKQYRVSRERTTGLLQDQGILFDSPAGVESVSVHVTPSAPLVAGTELLVVFADDGSVRAYDGFDQVAAFGGEYAAAAQRLAEGRGEVYAVAAESDAVLGTVHLQLACRGPRPA